VLVITAVGVLNLVQIRETTADEASAELQTRAEFGATLQSQWVRSMKTQTQVISGNTDPESVRGRFPGLSLRGAPWESSESIVAIHYVNVSQNRLVASTQLNYSERSLGSIEEPWVGILTRVDPPAHANSTVWLTNESYTIGQKQ
jgi:methyl-accepting chemotaxis protein